MCLKNFAKSSLKYAVTKYNKLNNYQVYFFLKYEALYNKLQIQMETVITKDCFQISNVIKTHLWPHTLMSDTLFLPQNDGKGLWKDDSLNKRKIKLKSRTSHSLVSLDFKDEVKLFQSFQIAKLFSLQFLLILYHFIWGLY